MPSQFREHFCYSAGGAGLVWSGKLQNVPNPNRNALHRKLLCMSQSMFEQRQ
jgi:hypothetical protein